MNEEYQNKLAVAKVLYQLIISSMEIAKLISPYKIDFCWGECIRVDDELFNDKEMKDGYNG